MVSDDRSLCDSARRLQPRVVVVDVALAQGDICGLIRRLRSSASGSKVILLGAHIEAAIVAAAKEAGADAMVNKRAIASDLLRAVDAVLRDEPFFEGETAP